MMGSLQNFLGKSKEIEIKGTKITIHPLTLKNMHLFSKENSSEEEKVKMSKDILKLSISDTTDEEVDNLTLEMFTKLMEEINKLNGFTDEKFDTIRKRIEQRKTRA